MNLSNSKPLYSRLTRFISDKVIGQCRELTIKELKKEFPTANLAFELPIMLHELHYLKRIADDFNLSKGCLYYVVDYAMVDSLIKTVERLSSELKEE